MTAKPITHCPWCGSLASVADEPYCAYAHCRWNNGGTEPERLRKQMAPAEIQDLRDEAIRLLDKAFPAVKEAPKEPCNKDPRGCWNVRCQLGKACVNAPEKTP